MNRRHFLQGTACSLTLGLSLPRWSLGETFPLENQTPTKALATVMKEYMDGLGTPGGALAVLQDGKLRHAEGYGWADRDAKVPTTSRSLFRLASLSKPITAAAVLKLIQSGELRLTDHVFTLLDLERFTGAAASFDERWRAITIGHLLHHTGGWDREQSFDPMFRSRRFAEQFGHPSPAGAWDVIHAMLGYPLDFDPGQRYAYSNFGYCLLGRAIEKVTGKAYEAYVRETLLEPAGCPTMRLGRSLLEHRAEGEVRYYMADEETTASVFDAHPDPVPAPYGGFNLEAMDAHGGWIASVEDLARLSGALFHQQPKPLLSAEMMELLRRPPPPPAWRNEDGELNDHYYGCGWLVRPKNDGANFWHSGSLPGTTAIWVNRHDGISFAALFNLRSRARSRDLSIDPMLNRALRLGE